MKIRQEKLFAILSMAGILGAGSIWAQSNEPSLAQQNADQNKQLLQAASEHSQKMQDLLIRDEKDLEQKEKLLDRENLLEDRYSKILDTWERQQAEYRQYLNSLKK